MPSIQHDAQKERYNVSVWAVYLRWMGLLEAVQNARKWNMVHLCLLAYNTQNHGEGN